MPHLLKISQFLLFFVAPSIDNYEIMYNILQKRDKMASAYAFKEQKNVFASINSGKIPQNVSFSKISSIKISLFKSPYHHLPVENQQ